MPHTSNRKKALIQKKSHSKKIKKIKKYAYRRSPPKAYDPHVTSICNHKNNQRWRGIIDHLVHYTSPATLDHILQSQSLLVSEDRNTESKWSSREKECEPCAEEPSYVCSLAKGIYFRFLAYDRPFVNHKLWAYYGDIALVFSPEVLHEGYYHINTTLNSGFMFPMKGYIDPDETTYTDEAIHHMTPAIYDRYAPSMELLYRNNVSLRYVQAVFFKFSRDLFHYRPLFEQYNPEIECYLFPR